MISRRSCNIGQHFLAYYEGQGFQPTRRCSLLDPSLPMTFVMSAGRVHIDRAIARNAYRPGERFVLLQPCFRHFDLEKIGISPSHLSLFEMAGAYYFGRVSRKFMLSKILDFLFNHVGFKPETLWATWFSGGESEGFRFEADTESLQTLEDLGFLAGHIVGQGIDANLLTQGNGASGQRRLRKCGPMVEIFYDRGAQYRCGSSCAPGCPCGRFIEISNTLFVYWQFDQQDQTLTPMNTPFTETVIGVERLTMALRNAQTVFEIPGLAEVVEQVLSACEMEPFEFETRRQRQSAHLLVDHLRALLFLVADGALPPGKCGRRRIVKQLARGVLTHQKLLNIPGNEYLTRLIETIIASYQGQYPHLAQGRDELLQDIEEERTRFQKTLRSASRAVEKALRHHHNGTLSGTQALDFVKNHGLPLPLLERKLAQKGLYVNQKEYHAAYASWYQKVTSL